MKAFAIIFLTILCMNVQSISAQENTKGLLTAENPEDHLFKAVTGS